MSSTQITVLNALVIWKSFVILDFIHHLEMDSAMMKQILQGAIMMVVIAVYLASLQSTVYNAHA